MTERTPGQEKYSEMLQLYLFIYLFNLSDHSMK